MRVERDEEETGTFFRVRVDVQQTRLRGRYNGISLQQQELTFTSSI